MRNPTGRSLPKLSGVLSYVLVIAALALAILWIIPANYYLIMPGQAQRVLPMISIHGHHRSSGPGAIYDTYVNEYKVSHLLYLFLGLMRSDVSVEPAAQVSSGCPDQQYEQQLLAMMDDSKIQAEAAALHVLGHRIRTEPTPQIDEVSCNFPAISILRPGDRIVAVDGHRITGAGPPGQSLLEVQRYTRMRPPGSIVKLRIIRNGRTRTVSVPTRRADSLGDIVKSGGHTTIGIVMSLPFKFPLRVHIDSGNVGGPSAGLAFALGLIQQLTGRDLTHGNRVAVTGTIQYVDVNLPHGKQGYRALVGAIGGARQKAIAAQAAGAKYFLVPSENYAEALSARVHLKVIPVRTLHDALEVLRHLPIATSARGGSAEAAKAGRARG